MNGATVKGSGKKGTHRRRLRIGRLRRGGRHRRLLRVTYLRRGRRRRVVGKRAVRRDGRRRRSVGLDGRRGSVDALTGLGRRRGPPGRGQKRGLLGNVPRHAREKSLCFINKDERASPRGRERRGPGRNRNLFPTRPAGPTPSIPRPTPSFFGVRKSCSDSKKCFRWRGPKPGRNQSSEMKGASCNCRMSVSIYMYRSRVRTQPKRAADSAGRCRPAPRAKHFPCGPASGPDLVVCYTAIG